MTTPFGPFVLDESELERARPRETHLLRVLVLNEEQASVIRRNGIPQAQPGWRFVELTKGGQFTCMEPGGFHLMYETVRMNENGGLE